MIAVDCLWCPGRSGDRGGGILCGLNACAGWCWRCGLAVWLTREHPSPRSQLPSYELADLMRRGGSTSAVYKSPTRQVDIATAGTLSHSRHIIIKIITDRKIPYPRAPASLSVLAADSPSRKYTTNATPSITKPTRSDPGHHKTRTSDLKTRDYRRWPAHCSKGAFTELRGTDLHVNNCWHDQHADAPTIIVTDGCATA